MVSHERCKRMETKGYRRSKIINANLIRYMAEPVRLPLSWQQKIGKAATETFGKRARELEGRLRLFEAP